MTSGDKGGDAHEGTRETHGRRDRRVVGDKTQLANYNALEEW